MSFTYNCFLINQSVNDYLFICIIYKAFDDLYIWKQVDG